MSTPSKKVADFYDALAYDFDLWKKKNSYYHKYITNLYKFLIPPKQKVLEIGCATGDLLASIPASKLMGVDISQNMIDIAQKKYPKLSFLKSSLENLPIKETFDYIILSDVVGMLEDIEKAFSELHKVSNENSRIIINYNNYFWEPLFLIFAKFGLKAPQPTQSWLSEYDIENLLNLANFEIIKKGEIILIPIYVPYFSEFANKYLARLPLLKYFCFVKYFVVKKASHLQPKKEYSVSIILPARNEAGNIEKGVREIPNLGKKTEIIFVEDHSKDTTREEVKRVVEKYKNKKNIRFFIQDKEYGKAAAVRKGFSKATGDILIVFDSDLTTDPKDLPKFYHALRDGKAELIQGSRMIYPLEKDAMRNLNVIGNKFFGLAFTYLLDQPIKDTLCGTKVLFKKDYLNILKNKSYFGDFDPFGDFDLIFGATKLNLKIIEIPIRYKARIYGKTNISRFKHGWLLLKMTLFAAKKIKFF